MKADEYLEKLGISFEEVVQDNPTKGCDEAAKERGVETSQIVKSLIIESEGEKLHICIPGDRTLSESKFGSEYRMVPPKESKELTGFESGTVHPFSTDLKHFFDERILEKERVSHTVGEKKRGIIIESAKFEEAVVNSDFSFEIMDIVVSTQEDFNEIEDYGLDTEDAKFVVNNGYRNLFKDLVSKCDSENILSLLEAVNRETIEVRTKPAEKLLNRAENQTHMQKLVSKFAETGELPEQQEFNLNEKVSELLDENPDAVQDFRDGKESAVNYLIGQLMQETNGKADAGKARKKILSELNES